MRSGPTLTLALICRDEEDNLAQCLKSVRHHVNQCVVVDTGSIDQTRKVAVGFGCDVYQFDIHNHPEAFFIDDEKTCTQFGAPPPYSGDIALGDFAAARNESFKHATGDFILWIDADDVLEQGERLREVVSEMASRNLDMGFLPYDYARDHLGRVFYKQWRERIIRRGVANWMNPVHEVLMPVRPPAMSRYDSPLVVHKRKADRKSIPNRNYKNLLRQAWQLKTASPDAPLDPRILFYLGQEARFIEPKRAVSFYDEYLQTSGWPEERAAAHVAIGQLLEFGALGMPPGASYQQANREYASAAVEVPENPDGVFGLARIAYLRGRYQDCVNYSERGLKIGNTESMLGANPMDRLYRPHIYYNHALAHLGRIDEALKSCEAGLSVCPDDPGVPGGASGMLSLNANAYKEMIAERAGTTSAQENPMVEFDKNEDVDAAPIANIPRDAQVIWAMQLWKQIVACGDGAKARSFLDSLPSSITSDPAITRMVASTERRFPAKSIVVSDQRQGDRSVVFYLGPGVEPWDPTTPNKVGLGGSETAAIEMARHLAALGRPVKVYAEASGVFNGVEYLHHSSFRGANCGVFISSRVPAAIDQCGPVTADLKLLWVHDIHCGHNSPQMERWLYQFDRVLCLSEWHKGFFLQCYPSLHPDTVIVTRNGIDPARFAGGMVKENRMVFSSSPNRGLPTLLLALRRIRVAVPDVHLDVFYGCETWETMARARGDRTELDQIAAFKRMIEEAEAGGGVSWHGRQPQDVLARAFMRAKIWSYPTQFPETSCISAMEAQAAGCVPVTTRFAALAETVKHGVLLDPSPGYEDHFVAHCVRLLTHEKQRQTYAISGRKWALDNLSWKALADEWSEMFDDLIAEVAVNPMHIWRSA